MKNKTHAATPTRAAKSASPAKAKNIARPPFDGYVTYCYTPTSTHGKTEVLTPGETNKYPMPAHIGASHNFMRSPNGTEYEEGDFDQPEAKESLNKYFNSFLVELVNLTQRVKTDRHVFTSVKPNSKGHHHFAKKQIGICITKLKNLMEPLKFDDQMLVLNRLNEAIQEKTIYNPFGLQAIYAGDRYNLVEAQKSDAHPVLLSLDTIFPAKHTPKKSPSGVASVGIFASPPATPTSRHRPEAAPTTPMLLSPSK